MIVVALKAVLRYDLASVNAGIGAEAARHLAKLGARIAIVGRNESRLNAVAEDIRLANGATPLAIVADVNKDTDRIIDETIQRFGQLDVLVNNVGIGETHSTVADVSMDAFDTIFDTNVRSVVQLTKLAVPHLERTRGNVVNVSSVAGLRPLAGLFSYCISKAALNQFTRCAALDLGPKGIRVNALNPGLVETRFFEAAGFDQKSIEQIFAGAKLIYPLRRTGLPTDTSTAIAYLASEGASFITGALLPVDGGELLK